ncbi:MAG TPA: class I SAM-dependent methyltransferase [Planctomycetaceae bacterium]|nr:class I SAM-dependent methyltransferase [Planctomycetaceae bacterium]
MAAGARIDAGQECAAEPASSTPAPAQDFNRRFPFGRNWAKFLANVDAGVVEQAKQSLADMLETPDLQGRSFLDVGCGSGLFSLAARNLGARVVSFDYDPLSVACAEELKARYRPGDPDWTVTAGSVLDESFLASLARFDVVYSWGVLHHTGNLRAALANTARLVNDGGLLYVAIYNDQGRASRRWLRIKQLYNRLPRALRFLVLAPAFLRLWGPTTVRDLLRGRPFETWREYPRHNRGMSPWRDLVDWVGGYPFEVARPEHIVDACRDRGFTLRRLKTCGGGRGCNEFVFTRK